MTESRFVESCNHYLFFLYLDVFQVTLVLVLVAL